MRRTIRPAIWQAAALVAAMVLAWIEPVWAGGGVYTYVDSRGVSHFTNVPNDSRYVLIPKPRRARRRVPAPQNRGYDGLIRLTAAENRVSPALVKAVIAAESSFDQLAVSAKGAQGLMQLMPATAAELGVTDAFSADQNVAGGARYLREMLDRYDDLGSAIAAYNAGPTAVDRYRGIPPYPETRDYVKRVLTYYRHYHGDFGQ
ncbi:MAG: transglycosylase SLT domain-containing protein [Myxococcota bacterium]